MTAQYLGHTSKMRAAGTCYSRRHEVRRLMGCNDLLESLQGKSHCRVQDNSARDFHLAESIGHVQTSGVWPALCHHHTELDSLHNRKQEVAGKLVQTAELATLLMHPSKFACCWPMNWSWQNCA